MMDLPCPDVKALTYGLPACLRVPIAAVDQAALKKHVGKVDVRLSRKGQPQVLVVRSYPPAALIHSQVALWRDPKAREFQERLFPELQLWVDVNFEGYREAFKSNLHIELDKDTFLDHVQNRKAVRLRLQVRPKSHRLLRLCPVHRSVNTSGGHSVGGEGMEKAYLATVMKKEDGTAHLASLLQSSIQYADPMDLTKMLNIKPGARTLDGVRNIQELFAAG